MYKNLTDFVNTLDKANELIRINEFVNPDLEITEVVDRISKQSDGGKALLFENTGTGFPLLINSFGSIKRMCLAFGVNNLDVVGKEIESLFNHLVRPKKSILDKIKTLPELSRIARCFPTLISGKGACQEVISMNPDLSRLPILKCWPHDGGRFITLPMVNTKDPVTGIRNVGMYRMQVFSPNETALHWHRHKTGARHFQEYKKLNKLMPVAVALGGDPVYTYAATAPLPDNLDEYILAGFIRKKRVRLVKGITVDIEIPEDVDFVIEGYVDPNEELIWEGPFGDHTGFYSLADWYPKFHVTCITHRKNAIYPATIVGIPPMEDAYIARATERVFLSPMRYTVLPEIEDINLPAEGVAHNIAIVKVKNLYPGHSYKVMNSLWGAGQMMLNKILVVTDVGIDHDSYFQFSEALINNLDVSKDIFFSRGPLDVLDHSSEAPCFGSKMFIDAMQKVPSGDGFKISTYEEDIAEDLADLPNGITGFNCSLIKHNIPVVIFSLDTSKNIIIKDLAHRLSRLGSLRHLKAMIFVDKELDIKDISLVIWYLTANLDPQRDTFIIYDQSRKINCIALDGTRKISLVTNTGREWPNVVLMNRRTIQAIDDKWEKLGIGSHIISPSLRLLQLAQGEGPIAK